MCTSVVLFVRQHHILLPLNAWISSCTGWIHSFFLCNFIPLRFGWNSNLLGGGPKSLFTQFVLSLGLIRWCWKDDGLKRPGSVFSLCWSWVHPLRPSLAHCGCPWPSGHPQLLAPLPLSLIYSTLTQLRAWSLLSPLYWSAAVAAYCCAPKGHTGDHKELIGR